MMHHKGLRKGRYITMNERREGIVCKPAGKDANVCIGRKPGTAELRTKTLTGNGHVQTQPTLHQRCLAEPEHG